MSALNLRLPDSIHKHVKEISKTILTVQHTSVQVNHARASFTSLPIASWRVFYSFLGLKYPIFTLAFH